jgi:hypothetical protein
VLPPLSPSLPVPSSSLPAPADAPLAPSTPGEGELHHLARLDVLPIMWSPPSLLAPFAAKLDGAKEQFRSRHPIGKTMTTADKASLAMKSRMMAQALENAVNPGPKAYRSG